MTESTCRNCNTPELKRRDFLRVGSLSLFGIGMSQFLAVQHALAAAGVGDAIDRAKARACILLWLQGGPSHIDLWDPKPNSNFRPISTNVDGIRITELLPRVAKHMDKLAVIRSMHTEEIDHPEAIHYAMTGHRQNPAMQFPAIGSILARELGERAGIPPYVIAPQMDLKLYQDHFGAQFIGPEYEPFITPDPSAEDFQLPDLNLPKSVSVERVEQRRAFRDLIEKTYRQKREIAEFGKMDTFTAKALEMILSDAVKQAFDLSQETEKTRERYGKHAIGQSALLARRLVEAGSRFVTAAGYRGVNPWDSHAQNDSEHRDKLAPPLDQALSALLEDLHERGLLESTIVMAMGEFGRTPHINPNNGRDHWPHCWSMVIGGGGLRGGQVIGASDERGAYVAERMVTMGDLFATIYKAMGIDWEKTYMTPIGRPIKLANSIDDKTGTPLAELV